MKIEDVYKERRIVFGEILGTIPSDAHLGPRSDGKGLNYILCSKDREFVERLIIDFSEFDINVILHKRKTGLWYIETSKKWLFNFLLYINKLENKWVFSRLTLDSSALDFKAAVIRSFADAEGTVTCKIAKNNFYSRRIAIYNQSVDLLSQLKLLLNSFGIICYIRLDRLAREAFIKKQKIKFPTVYSLRITNYRNLKIFSSEIGFNITRKMDKLNMMLGSYRFIGRNYMPEEYYSVLSLYEEFKNCRKVSRQLKIPPQTVQNWTLLGIRPRTMKVKEFNSGLKNNL